MKKNFIFKRLVFGLAVLLATSWGYGASVIFGEATYGYSSLNIYDGTWLYGGNFYFIVYCTPIGGAFSLSPYPRSARPLQYAITTAVANVGDVAGESFFDSRTEFFTYAYLEDLSGCDSRSDYDLTIVPDQSTYLAYHIDDGSVGDLYGWVEFGVVDGAVTVLNSAIDISGASLVVGAIPEPAVSLLLAFGGAAFVLRRKRSPAHPGGRRSKVLKSSSEKELSC